ncbi:MAG: hypothetical protein M1814_000408 [Vezdaea aestivalis]|nr:MAG: hypothetical protein M1814_000408 [Vezdaea aestivalis]
MSKDSRKGQLHWRGCHSFENIVYDGDELYENGIKRDGGLKMGGKYWYYYQLDGEIEYHNPVEPFTSACPLLPGQCLNVLDIPSEVSHIETRRRSGSGTSFVFTMNPSDKYTTPRPVPSPTAAGSESQSPSSPTSTTFGRLRRKMSGADDVEPAATSHSVAASLRSTFSFTNLKSLPSTQIDAGGDKSWKSKVPRPSKPADWEISEPVLVSRTDENRPCISLEEASANMAAHDLVTTPKPGLPSPKHMASETLASDSPLRTYLKDRSWDNSPLIPSPPRSASLPSEMFQSPRSIFGLKPILPKEIEGDNHLVRITSQTLAAAEEEDDDFNFNSEGNELPLESNGLSPPPSRARPETAVPFVTPSFSSARPPSRAPPPAPIKIDQSHFSFYSETTTIPSTQSSAPSSPTFSSLASDDEICYSPPYYTRQHKPSETSPPVASTFSSTSFRSRSNLHLSMSPALPSTGHVLYHGITTDAVVTTSPLQTSPTLSPTCQSFSTPRPRYGFQAYSLPEDDNTSQMTLEQKSAIPSTLSSHSGTVTYNSSQPEMRAEPGGRSTFGPTPAPWSEQVEDLQVLENELGYLGELIV